MAGETKRNKANPIAKELRQDGKYRQRIVPDKTKYDRQRNKGLGECWTAPWPSDDDGDEA